MTAVRVDRGASSSDSAEPTASMSCSRAVLLSLPAAFLAALLLLPADAVRAQPFRTGSGASPAHASPARSASPPAASVVLRRDVRAYAAPHLPDAAARPRHYEFSTGFPVGAAGAYPPAETASSVRPFDAGPTSDPWLAFDKVQHLTFSFLWTLGSQYALVNKASWTEGQALPVSAGVGGAVGLAKEYYDWRAGARHYFSHRDLVADAAGIVLAVGFILL